MKNRNIVCIIIASLTALVLCFSSCMNQPSENESTTAYEYIPSGSETTSTEPESSSASELMIDDSWKKSFDITYKVLNPEVNSVPFRIRERKSENAYTIEYLDGNSLYFCKQTGSDVEKYTIIESEKEQLHKVYKNSFIADRPVVFYECSFVEKNLPSLSNVCYEYDETIAGRECSKYIQRAYTDGKATATVYLWIDKEFGFAARQEEYDGEGRLVAMLELIEFSTGSTKDEDVIIDISQYTFKEEQ